MSRTLKLKSWKVYSLWAMVREKQNERVKFSLRQFVPTLRYKSCVFGLIINPKSTGVLEYLWTHLIAFSKYNHRNFEGKQQLTIVSALRMHFDFPHLPRQNWMRLASCTGQPKTLVFGRAHR